MRRTLILAVIGVVVFLFVGCEEEPTSPLDPPSNLTITANPDGLTLTVSWTKSPSEDTEDGIDGYYVYFNGELEADLEPGTYQYQFSPDCLGPISVTAYRGDEESNEVSVSTETVDRTDIVLAAWESSDPSSIAWDRTTGMYTLYNTVSDNAELIDLVWDSRDMSLNSPDVFWDSGKQNGVAEDDDTGVAPETGEGNYYNFIRDIAAGQGYYVELEDGYFLFLSVDSIDDSGNAHISYKFQKIQGYRRVYNPNP